MFRSISIFIALLMHSIFLAWIPVFAIARWSGLTFRGIIILLLAFTVHAAGIFGIVKRLKWGYSYCRWVFGFYTVTSGFGLLGQLVMGTPMSQVSAACFFIVFIWLFLRFQSDPSVRNHFQKTATDERLDDSREERLRKRFESREM